MNKLRLSNPYSRPFMTGVRRVSGMVALGALIFTFGFTGCENVSSPKADASSQNDLIIGSNSQQERQKEIESESEQNSTVLLTIDFSGRKENIKLTLDCSESATVFEVMEKAKENGDLEFRHNGSSPQQYFVSAIGGIENEGASGPNWVYRVNGELGDSGCGVFEVKKGDQIVWKLGKYP